MMTMNIVLLVLLGLALLIYGREMVQPESGSSALSVQALPIVNGKHGDVAHSATSPGQTGDNEDMEQAADLNTRGPGTTLFNFAGQGPSWNIINDNVMGGLSMSSVRIDQEREQMTFSGSVSLENNGGFASARSQWLRYDLGEFDGVALRVRGDGHVYRFRIRTEETGPAVSYTALFQTEKDVWQDVYIPFRDMVPLYRGYVVDKAGPLDASSVRSFGLMVADKQSGDFELDIDWINAVREKENEVYYLGLEAG